MKPIKIIKNKPKRKTPSLDPKKEGVIKELAELLENRGFLVRREPLKQGVGFKVMSGTCRANEKLIILLDRRLPQNEQISFLVGKFITQEKMLSEEELTKLSTDARSLLELPASAASVPCLS